MCMISVHILILVSLVLRNNSLLQPEVLTFCFWSLSVVVFALYLKTSLMNPGYWPSINSAQKPVEGTFSVLVEERVSLDHENIPTVKDESMPAVRDYSSVVIKCENVVTVKDSNDNANDISSSGGGTNHVESTAELSVKGKNRWCSYCRMVQSYRTKHCRDCNRCVALYDHHCPWIGGCVGQNNRIYFFWYVFFQCIELWLAVYYVMSS